MARINQQSITAKILKANKTQAKAFEIVNRKVFEAKSELLSEFDNSTITKEILAGPDVPSSEVLPQGYGNLFSFLGFKVGRNPIEPVREVLNRIFLVKRPKVIKNNLEFKLRIPSDEDIEKVSPMDWESGRSWVSAVTYGLSGFSRYMFSLTQNRFKTSRGETGIQAKHNIRSSSVFFRGKSYVFGMLSKFRRKFIR